MKIQRPNVDEIAGSEYSKHFKTDEFKFRWADAFGLLPRTERQKIDHHVLLTLCTYMDVLGSCYPSVEAIARRMGVSKIDTVRKSLHRLQECGWLSITERSNHTNVYQAILPNRGSALLISDLQQREFQIDSTWRTAQAKLVILEMCKNFGFNAAQILAHQDWDRLRGRVEQIISRMNNPHYQLTQLLQHIVETPPKEIYEPIGFVFERLSQFTQTFPEFSGIRRKQTGTSTIQPVQGHLAEGSNRWAEVAAILSEPDPDVRNKMRTEQQKRHQR